MTDKEKIERLEKILASVLAWYKKALAEEGADYVYDTAYERFDMLTRGEIEQILSILNS